MQQEKFSSQGWLKGLYWTLGENGSFPLGTKQTATSNNNFVPPTNWYGCQALTAHKFTKTI
jgi:hypothetical protein